MNLVSLIHNLSISRHAGDNTGCGPNNTNMCTKELYPIQRHRNVDSALVIVQKAEYDLVLYDRKDIVIFVVGGSQKQKHLTTTHNLIPLLYLQFSRK